MGDELQLSLLGKLQISRDGASVTGFVSSKVQALLCYLAVTGRPHDRQALAGLLWGEMPEAEARSNLRMALSNLRKLLEPYLVISRNAASFNRASPYWLDVEIFNSILASAALDKELPLLRYAVESYRGDFMEGFSVREAPAFEEWMLGQRERLRQLALQGLHTLAVQHTARGEHATAIDYSSRLLALEPWREEGHRQLMLLLAQTGQRSAALAQYETCRRILAEELGVEPLAETQALYERLKAAAAPRPHNLPPQPTPFVGRQEELARIARYLDKPACRLVTLIGPGGIGKTRLVLEAAAHYRQGPVFPDGVFFVPLAAVSSPELLVPAIAEALKLSLSGPAEPKTQLLNHLRYANPDMLLVLDNFEHLLAGVDLLPEILRHAPQLKLLVTARERLNLQEEWLLEVEGLRFPKGDWRLEARDSETGQIPQSPMPDPPLPISHYRSPITNLQTYSAVALFIQHAQRVQAGFSLSTGNQAEVIRLCQLMNGMPLGLELAATWLPLLSCGEIVAEIERDFDFLATALRNIPERHRSMRVVFESSWNLLSQTERNVLKKLSVFRGGFRTEAALQVTGASLSLLLGLMSKSLLRRDASGRYDLHELLRQYAAEKLTGSPGESASSEQAQTLASHCRYYAGFLQQRGSELKGGKQREALEEINAEIENIRLAWHWAVEHQYLNEIEQLLAGLWLFYETRSWFQEGEATFGQALEHLAGGRPPTGQDRTRQRVLGRLLACQGRLLYGRGLYDKAKKVLQDSLSIFRRLDQPDQIAFSLHSLGLVAAMQGEYALAKELSQESLALYQSLDDRQNMAWPLYNLGRAAYNLGEYPLAQQFTEESLALHRQLGDQRGVADCLSTLGLIVCGVYEYSLKEHHQAAEQFFHENLAIRRTIGDRRGEATALHNLGYIQCQLEQYAQAEERFQASIAISREIGELYLIAATSMWLGMTAMEQERYAEARRYFLESLRIADETGGFARATDVLCRIGDLLKRQGQKEEAVKYLAFVHQHPATDERVRIRAGNYLTELAAELPPEVVAAAQAREAGRELKEIVAKILGKT